MSKTYFLIEKSKIVLKENEIYPFHINVYSYKSGLYRLYLAANSPLSLDKYTFLQELLDKGASLAINHNQKYTYLSHQSLQESDIASLQKSPLQELANRSFDLKKSLEEKDEKEGPFLFEKNLEKSFESDDFMPLINRVRSEAMTLSLRVSHTVSLANHFCELLLVKDNTINRIVALSYLLCKTSGIDDEQSLGEILCAAYLSHIGLTQLKLDMSRNAQLDFTSKEKNDYKKHPGLTQHLIRKSGLMISERCNKIMYQHHERFDGNGYPEYKRGEHMEPLALILGASAHLIEFTQGHITGQKNQIKNVIQSFKDYASTPGLELNFGDQVQDMIKNLLQEKVQEKKVA